MYVHLIAVPLFAVILLWSLRQFYGRDMRGRDDSMMLVMTIGAWVLFYLSIGVVFGPLLFFVSLIIGGMVVARYRQSERCTLLWLLAIAAEKGIPLSQAARSYAAGRTDEMGRRGAALADYLEQGMSLPNALNHSRNTLPSEGILAARLGFATDTLAITLKEAAQDRNQAVVAANAAYGGLLYFFCVLNAMILIFFFGVIRILPTYEAITAEFDVEMPAITRMIIQVGHGFSNYWFLCLPLVMLSMAFLLYALIGYMGFRLPALPLIGRFWGRMDTAIILRSLASGLAQKRPIDQTIDLLAHWYPVPHVGAKLAAAGERVRQGADWCDSLLTGRLVSVSDAAVLKAAHRVDNLEWACRELADAKSRRFKYRTASLARFVGPLFAIGLGIPIAFFAIGMLLPIASVIEALAR